MKRYGKSILGVTLLEIMLVLAVAAMVIVMSIRYYQGATNSQNANMILQQFQSIVAAADNIAQGGGSYSAATSAAVTTIVGARNMKSPYGDYSVSWTSPTLTVSIASNVPAAVCTLLLSNFKSNPKYNSGTCSGGALAAKYNTSQ